MKLLVLCGVGGDRTEEDTAGHIACVSDESLTQPWFSYRFLPLNFTT